MGLLSFDLTPRRIIKQVDKVVGKDEGAYLLRM